MRSSLEDQTDEGTVRQCVNGNRKHSELVINGEIRKYSCQYMGEKC